MDVGMCGAGATLKVGYMNESDDATPHLGHIFGGLLQLLLLSAEFSPYSAMRATDGMARTTYGPLS